MRTTTLRVAVLRHEPETGLGDLGPLLDDAGADHATFATVDAPLPDPRGFDAAIVLGGSPAAYDPDLVDARRWARDAVLAGVPVLGICLGAQLLAAALGGVVRRRTRPLAGVHEVSLTGAGARDPLFGGGPHRFAAFGWHEDEITALPPGAVWLAGSLRCTFEAFRYGAATYGLQFHPEVRTADLARWRRVPGYAELLERSGSDWETAAAGLAGAEAELDALAGRVLDRWLCLVGSGDCVYAMRK